MEEHKNKVELIGTYGSDETHALSAWTSTSRDLTEEKRGRMGKLLTMLATEKHHTPFEKSAIQFLITTEINTHYQILKHRIGVSVSGESARYKELKDDKFYIPDDWSQDEQALLIIHCQDALRKYHECLKRLVAAGVPKKRAKESARFYLPQANQITADVMFNFRSLMLFQNLRNEDGAQKEIHDLAQQMLVLVEQTGNFKLSLDAFGWTKEKIYG
jgi:flavin-dependent thymidylate synthase